jgi:hypothetical protein
MIAGLFFEALFVIVAFYLGCMLIAAAAIAVPVAIASALLESTKRVATRGRSALRWSSPAETVATMLIAEEATSCDISFRHGLKRERLTLLFVPLSQITSTPAAKWRRGEWQIFCPQGGGGTMTHLPWSGTEIASQLGLTSYDRTAAADALDQVMSALVTSVWDRD